MRQRHHNERAIVYGQRLRAELEQRGWGVRTLAREMAKSSNHSTENIRRQLTSYVTGVYYPTTRRRNEIAAALGLPPEEEEEDLGRTLAQTIVAIVAREIQELQKVAS
jgi:transcriptional regulator with XRE-family HTH domain